MNSIVLEQALHIIEDCWGPRSGMSFAIYLGARIDTE